MSHIVTVNAGRRAECTCGHYVTSDYPAQDLLEAWAAEHLRWIQLRIEDARRQAELAPVIDRRNLKP